MSYSDALLLTTSGDNWSSLTSSGVTPLGFTFYSTVNPFPDYYYSDAPTDTVWASEYTDNVTAGSEDFVQTAQKTLIRHDLSDTTGIDYRVSFSDVSNLTFSEQNSPSAVGQIFIANANVIDPDAFGQTVYPESANGYSTFAGDVWLDNDTTTNPDGFVSTTVMQSELSVGQMGAYITLHELGHAVGLLHPTETALTGTIYDNQKYTIMTDDPLKTDTDMDPSVYPTGLQLLDIAVLQSMYGVNWGGIRGEGGALENTVYSKDGAFATANAHDAFIYTIWDGAGTDVIDASGYSTPAEIDLRQGHFSSIGVMGDSGDTPVAFDSGGVDHGNLAIAYFTVIENAIGTSGADTLIGNAWNNVLYGGGGNDTIYGDGATYDGDAGFHTANTIADSTSTVYSWGPDAVAPASDLSGNDVLIGGTGDDYFYGGKGNDVIHGGYNSSDIDSAASGWDPAGEFTGTNNAAATALSNISYGSDGTDTVDYSQLPEGTSASAGITVTYYNTSASNPILVEKGHSDEYGTDSLFSIEKIVGTPWNDSFSGTTYSGDAYIYGSGGVDTVDLTSTTTTVDYSLYNPVDIVGSVEVYNSGSDVIVLKSEDNEDTLTNVATIIGTNNEDSFDFASNDGLTLTYAGGAGGDNYEVGADNTGTLHIVEAAVHGVDTVVIDSSDILDFYGFSASSGHETINVAVESSWNSLTSTYDYTSYLTFNASTLGDGYGVELLNLYSDDTVRASDLYQFLSTTTDDVTAIDGGTLYTDLQLSLSDSYTGGTGGVGAGGGVLPTYDGSGNVTSMQISPAVGGSPISYGIADVIDNPLVLTSFSESFSGGTYTATTSWATYEQAFNFIGGITPGDVRLTASGSQGDAALTINIDSLGFSLTISDFETGNTISGIEIYNSTLHGLIQDASGATLVSTGTNTFGGSYLTLTGLDVDTSASVNVTYFLEALNFAGGGSIDLTAPITFTGTDSGETLTGLDDRADTIYGLGGDDNIYGYGGNDTLIGGAGDDQLYGGTGDDTYVFAAGWGNDTIHENTSEGTDTLHFTGIAPSDIRMYTDAYGYLHLVQISDPSNSVTVIAAVTGDNNAESTVGSYVESVTFDSSYSTTWDLTGGLTLTGDNSGDSLYGTAHNDVITGGTGDDYIYGNAGNDTIIGGTGSDNLYGGPGDDTYVFSSGFGSSTVHENLSEGSDTIHLTGINPADVRLWTDGYGYLHIEDTTHPSDNITVVAGVTGDNNAESTIGSYVEQITFDSSYSTTWDLTGGLHITGDNSGDTLYGTAYNDVITGGTGDDYIYGNAGNDTITGGIGSDNLYGGPGDDTYVFASGFGSSTVHENLSEGSDTIHLTGINPADVRLWTDGYGYLHIEDTTHPSDNISVVAAVTGDNNAESTIGSYVEQITFDSTYSTTWDLTGGLHITGDNGGDSLYGTAYGDTITGGTGVDNIYGNAGDDVLYGAGGNDNLTGGPGADTFLFKAATALTGVAAIADFNTSDGDKIDLANVISTYDPLTMLIANFVQLDTSGSDTQVKVDTDGSGTSYTQIATITGVTGLNLTDMITDGNLIVHHT